MGLLVDGKWYDDWDNSKDNDGRLIETESQFRSWITADGSAGPTGESGFQAEPNRYHLYIAYPCPWAHRALVMRKLKGLDDLVSVSVLNPDRGEKGWSFEQGDDVDRDPVLDADYLHQIYAHAKSSYTGRVSVPVLYDLKLNKIVNNESAEIMRMFNTAFDEVGANDNNYYPEKSRQVIDELNDEILIKVNTRVYKASYAEDEDDKLAETEGLYQAFDELESRLESNRYLLGDELTETDWRLFVTLIRFDHVYHEKLNSGRKRIADYKNLGRYTKELYEYPGISETVNFDHM